MKRCLILVCVLCSLASAIAAQNIKGAIAGRIVDANGSAVADAEIIVSDLQRGLRRHSLSGPQGEFYLPGLEPGIYRVRAARDGFEPYEVEKLELQVGQVINLEIKLQVSRIRAEVTVTADALTRLQFDDAKQSRSFNRTEMNDLPVQASGTGRNFYAQALTAPGVAPSVLAHRPFAVSGQRPRNNNYLIDSVEMNDANSGFIAGRGVTEQLISQEAIESFEIITHNFKAEYGRNSGSIVNLVSKSGTNEFRGSIYEYHNNSALAARNVLETEKAKSLSNLAGFTFGGPIRKNRAWFFGNYEFFRPRGTSRVVFQTLTDQERARAVPAVRPLVDLYPRSPSGSRLFVTGLPRTVNQNTYLIRADAAITDKQTLMVRTNYTDAITDTSGIGNAVASHVKIHNQTRSAAIHHSYAISAALLDELRLGYTRQTEADTFLDPVFLGDLKINGEVGFLIVPGLSPAGPLSFLGRANYQNTYQVSNDLTWTRGLHILKFGSSMRRVQVNGGAINNTFRGQLFFPNIEAFLAGRPLSYSRNFGNPMIGLRRTEWHSYLQDGWRIGQKLMLNFGIRYELNTAPTETADRIAERFRFRGDHNNFAPRFGFAWYGLKGTVVRGGYGIFYNAIEMAFIGLTRFNPPLIRNLTVFRPTLPNLLDRATESIPTGLVVPDRNARTPYAQHITLAIERELFSPRSTLKVSYVSTLGRKLSRTRRPNGGENLPQSDRPDKTVGVINKLETSANSNYHALEIELSQKLTGDLQVRAAYTYSRFIDDVSEFADSNQRLDPNILPLDEKNLRLDRALSDFDLTHMFALSYLYRLPLLRGNRWAGGWTISGITRLQSGRPYSLFSGTDNLAGTVNNRINNILGSLIRNWSSATPIRIAAPVTRFDLTPRAGTLGTLGRNTERTDSFLEWNISISKDFTLTERVRIQLRSEVYNLFNTANFNQVDNVLTSPTFGRVLSAFDPRRVQLALRIVF
jgi:hypothetical protein